MIHLRNLQVIFDRVFYVIDFNAPYVLSSRISTHHAKALLGPAGSRRTVTNLSRRPLGAAEANLTSAPEDLAATNPRTSPLGIAGVVFSMRI